MSDRILVVEDNIELKNALESILNHYKFNTIAVSCGKDALDIVDGGDVDLVLCDINLPDINGWEILHRLRNSKVHYALPFIFLTAFTADDDRARAMNGGADNYITKPFEKAKLVEAIRAQLLISNNNRLFFQEELHRNWNQVIDHSFKQEFLTPLNSLVNATYLMESASNDMTPIDFKETINAIYVASHRMFRNTRNLIIFSMITHEGSIASDALYPFQSFIFVSDIVLQIIEYYNNGLTMNWNIIKSRVEYLPMQRLSRDYLDIIFTELIDNGVKHDCLRMPPIVEFYSKNDGFEFVVTSNIADDRHVSLESIKPFKKFHNDETQNGLGLGLFVSRELCKKLNLVLEIKKENKKISFIVKQY
jgi:two-component system, sensor histidine kinase and response regulator